MFNAREPIAVQDIGSGDHHGAGTTGGREKQIPIQIQFYCFWNHLRHIKNTHTNNMEEDLDISQATLSPAHRSSRAYG